MTTPADKTRLDQALNTALQHYAEVMGTSFAVTPTLTVITDPQICAFADVEENTLNLHISTGTVTALDALWTTALADPAMLRLGDQQISNDPHNLTQLSLIWLIFHEMEHFGLRHFDEAAPLPLIEAAPQRFGLITSAKPSLSKQQKILSREARQTRAKQRELEADHEAIELLLEAYSVEAWPELRARAACISALMILIEKADETHHTGLTTHPKAATRIFQLLGHLTQLWSVPALLKAQELGATEIDPADLPPQNEIAAYQEQVILPAFNDALILAKASAAQTATRDLTDQARFFADIQNAQIGQWDQLSAPGAKEWVELSAKLT
ncbi:hypothetical protein [Pseudaestuariivita rosea]|uniref:hypothetical protein n=1 Tax=Pseudaestuariivita rosea TaxID=2763263 RepID=UPI001ABB4B11|nr:hypothetical protein [Pseudaestuariivita rosea]